MLQIKPIMNSCVEDVFGFKTCCGIRAYDQNLEIHVTNVGDRPLKVPSYLDLVYEAGSKRIETLMPHGEHTIEPNGMMAFYCYVDEPDWTKTRQIVFHDTDGNRYSVDIFHERA